MFKFEELELIEVIEEVREELNPLYIKHSYLHEMIREFYAKKDLDSETVKYLDKKLDELNARMKILQNVRDYLENLENGVPFNLNKRVGMYMARFGLTREQSQLLVDVYKDHRKSMGSEYQKKYLLVAARKVEWVEEEKCLHVHFDDTWWHYGQDGAWW